MLLPRVEAHLGRPAGTALPFGVYCDFCAIVLTLPGDVARPVNSLQKQAEWRESCSVALAAFLVIDRKLADLGLRHAVFVGLLVSYWRVPVTGASNSMGPQLSCITRKAVGPIS